MTKTKALLHPEEPPRTESQVPSGNIKYLEQEKSGKIAEYLYGDQLSYLLLYPATALGIDRRGVACGKCCALQVPPNKDVCFFRIYASS